MRKKKLLLAIAVTGLPSWSGFAGSVDTERDQVFSQEGKTFLLCNRWNNCVDVVEALSFKVLDQIGVAREPLAAALTKGGKHLLVANHLPKGPADKSYAAAVVSVIELGKGEVIQEFHLPNGSTAVKDLRVSPDGKYAVVTHLVAQFQRPTLHLRMGWIMANALTVLDLTRMEVLGSVLLDDRRRGAADPWGMAFSGDGRTLAITHAGTHEISIVDFPRLIQAILNLPAPIDPMQARKAGLSDEAIDQANYLPFFPSARRRIKLPPMDLGPRSIAIVSNNVFVTNYFSETLTVLDLSAPEAKPRSIALSRSGPRNPRTESDLVRKGEFYFHDATICFEGWQSCASCHPGGGRVDGLNWDLLNDGVGNPKNTKSLLLAFETPPAMSLGVRDSAEDAVRAGLRHILFTNPSDEIVEGICAYIKSLKPVPSPHLIDGQLSPSAKRGEQVFAKAGCASCHPPPLYTDLQSYDVGTRAVRDKATDKFDTPTLVEIWRTGPYLHDGSAATIRDVVTMRNPHDRHGMTSNLSSEEVDELCAYLLSL